MSGRVKVTSIKEGHNGSRKKDNPKMYILQIRKNIQNRYFF